MSKKLNSKTKTKTVAKVAAKPEGRVATRTLHILTDTARPVAGTRLFAHTQAALRLLGMATPKRQPVRRAAVTTVMGSRAVSYHLSQKNFEVTGDNSIRLTARGLKTITEREVEKSMVEKFVALFSKGKADSTIGVTKSNIAVANVAV
jgi:hypothetical protein